MFLIVDGVNFAAVQTRKEADALVSRMMRIRAAYGRWPVQVIVGHTAPPAGLNGERHMRDWIATQGCEAEVCDLSAEDFSFARRPAPRANRSSQGILPAFVDPRLSVAAGT